MGRLLPGIRPIYRWRYQIISYSNSQPPQRSRFVSHNLRISNQPDINRLCHTISFIMTPKFHSLNCQLSSSHDVSSPIPKDTSTAPPRSTNTPRLLRENHARGWISLLPSSIWVLEKGAEGHLLWLNSELHQDRYTCLTPSGSSRVKKQTQCSRRPPQSGLRRKARAPSWVTSARSEEKAWKHPRDHFSSRRSSRCRTLAKALCGSISPIRTTQVHYEVFHLHYWIQLSSGIPRSVESIFNAIMLPIQRKLLRMEEDISACQSEQPSVVIWEVTRESQHVNHAVMEIRTTRTISYDSGYLYDEN